MESALPRWQEGSTLAFCQREGGMMVVVGVEVGCTAEERREEKRPEGYPRRWIAPVLGTVKERRREIRGKKLIYP